MSSIQVNTLSLNDIHRLISEVNPELSKNARYVSWITMGLTLLGITPQGTDPAVVLSSLATLAEVGNLAVDVAGQVYTDLMRDKDLLRREQRMAVAYLLTVYSAYFTALEDVLRNELKEIDWKDVDAFTTVASTIENADADENLKKIDIGIKRSALHAISFPHPMDTIDDVSERLGELYSLLSKRIYAFFEGYIENIHNESLRKQENEKVISALETIPVKAVENFRAFLFNIVEEHDEFYLWLRLYRDEMFRQKLNELSEFVQQYVQFVDTQTTAIDVGLRELRDLTDSMTSDWTEVVSELVYSNEISALNSISTFYKNRITNEIFSRNDEQDPNLSDEGFRRPKKQDIYIPQAAQAIFARTSDVLENEKAWEQAIKSENIGTLLVENLSHPHSLYYPILLLGQPGSGKSLLAEMIAARFLCARYVTILIELRHLSSVSNISRMIEEQIYNDTQGYRITWPRLSELLHKRGQSLLLILDGFDERLQVSGKTNIDFLDNISQFQQQEIENGRAGVRVIVTSRLTLVDRAKRSSETAVLRLLPFDQPRQEKLLQIWSEHNPDISVSLLQNMSGSANRLAELMEQPLLLILLAIYVTVGNDLAGVNNQTQLYNRLIQSFVWRQLRKYDWFNHKDERQQQAQVDLELERLGIAAIGMFNRRSLHITKGDLTKDIAFFEKQRGISSSVSGEIYDPLTQGELLIGSFMFIYDSTFNLEDEKSPNAAYEFLHNTFGEFLAADYILREAVRHIRLVMRDIEYGDPPRFPDFDVYWYSRLAHAPLFRRPVILWMMNEWLEPLLNLGQKSNSPVIDLQKFLEAFDWIIERELLRLLNSGGLTRNEVAATNKGEPSSFSPLPSNGYTAIYTLNLLLLRAALSHLDSEQLTYEYPFPQQIQELDSADGVDGWTRLTSLWRSWFSAGMLTELGSILSTQNSKNEIILKLRRSEINLDNATQLQRLYYLGQALGDEVSSGITSLVMYRKTPLKESDWRTIIQFLQKSGVLSEVLHIILLSAFHSSLQRDKANFISDDSIQMNNADLKPNTTIVTMPNRAAWYLRLLHIWTSLTIEFSEDQVLDLLRSPDSDAVRRLTVNLAENMIESLRNAQDARVRDIDTTNIHEIIKIVKSKITLNKGQSGG